MHAASDLTDYLTSNTFSVCRLGNVGTYQVPPGSRGSRCATRSQTTADACYHRPRGSMFRRFRDRGLPITMGLLLGALVVGAIGRGFWRLSRLEPDVEKLPGEASLASSVPSAAGDEPDRDRAKSGVRNRPSSSAPSGSCGAAR